MPKYLANLQGGHRAYSLGNRFSRNYYDDLEDRVSFKHNWGNDNLDENESLGTLR